MTDFALICGVDEAGRGPLAGPVVVAAVILDPGRPIAGLNDSKALSERKRDRLAAAIKQHAIAFSISVKSIDSIARRNILHATMDGMREVIEALTPAPDKALVDGNRVPPGLTINCEALVDGDALEPAISAASIIAKTERDRYMVGLHARFPQYGFDRHKGYATEQHITALRRHGPCPEHRLDFAPVRELLQLDLPFAAVEPATVNSGGKPS
ncbi:MAG: ribonuclease HII [Lysobacteraceae bacterium]|nr:MAG: ribonuclease HII [Xanthomonadaceae bacterium]